MNGYGGNILRVNLTTGQITKSPTPPELIRDYVGGRGFNAYWLYLLIPRASSGKFLFHLAIEFCRLPSEKLSYFNFT